MAVVARPEVATSARRSTVGGVERPRARTAVRATPVAPAAWILPALVVVGGALRLWRTTTNGLTFDETYTALTGLRGFGLLAHLRATDLHPPLDYLLRAPLAQAHASAVVLRLPSVVFSTAALALFAWWMRRRNWVGVVATALFAFNVFQVFHGGEARMYALMQLLGVGAAVLADTWLRRPASWHAWALALVVTLAVFDHVSGFLLAAGVLAVAGARIDRDAWRWRVAVVGPVLLWAVAWGPSFLHQRGLSYSSWMPRTSFDAVSDVVAMQLTDVAALSVVVLVAVVVGGRLLVRADRRLGRVWLCCGVVPFAVASVLGLFEGLLWDRTLTCASWAVPLAVAAVLVAVAERWSLLGVALCALVVVLVVAETVTFFAYKRFDYDLSVDRLSAVVEPGDVVAVRPELYLALPEWRIAVRGDLPYHHVRVRSLGDADAIRLEGAAPTGRFWVLVPAGEKVRVPGTHPCASTWTRGVTELHCRTRRPG